jgi:hypothetical protein
MLNSYGALIRRLRSITNRALITEPKWRHHRPDLASGYQPRRKGSADKQSTLQGQAPLTS